MEHNAGHALYSSVPGFVLALSMVMAGGTNVLFCSGGLRSALGELARAGSIAALASYGGFCCAKFDDEARTLFVVGGYAGLCAGG
jgi:hypothetical protein